MAACRCLNDSADFSRFHLATAKATILKIDQEKIGMEEEIEEEEEIDEEKVRKIDCKEYQVEASFVIVVMVNFLPGKIVSRGYVVLV